MDHTGENNYTTTTTIQSALIISVDPMETLHLTTGQILKAILFSLIILISVLGNLFVIISVLVRKEILESTTNYFILNLALADLLVSITVVPFTSIKYITTPSWIFGPIYCLIWATLDDWTCSASILSLAVISLDRYIGVTSPLKYSMIMSKAKVRYLILLIWIISFLVTGPPLYIWPIKNPEGTCNSNYSLGRVLFNVIGTFYTPMMIICIFYWRIYKIVHAYENSLINGSMNQGVDTNGNTIASLRVHVGGYNNGQRQNKQRVISESESSTIGGGIAISGPPEINNGNSSNWKKSKFMLLFSKFNNQKKVSKQLGLVVGAFLICWTPFFTSLLAIILFGHGNSSIIISMLRVFKWFGYMNSCLNPFIYVTSSKQFKLAFKELLICLKLSKSNINTNVVGSGEESSSEIQQISEVVVVESTNL